MLSSCALDVDLFFLASLPYLFRFRFGHRLFHLVFSCGHYAAPSISVSARLMQHMICIFIRTDADLTLFLSEVYDLFHSLCELSVAGP